MPNLCHFKGSDQNIWKNSTDNYWTMASDMNPQSRSAKKASVINPDDLTSVEESYFRKPYMGDPWSGLSE